MNLGNFSDDTLLAYQELILLLSEANEDFSEEDLYDFRRCLRPNGTAYGTRGMCQTPNKEAPKVAQKEAPKADPLKMAAESVREALKQGKPLGPAIGNYRRIKEAYQGGGGKAAQKAGKSASEVLTQGKKNVEQRAKQLKGWDERNYKSGGGDAARREGKTIEDVIKKGRGVSTSQYDKNPLGYRAGGGDAAALRDKASVEDIVKRGKKNIAKMSKEDREAFEKGGGYASKKNVTTDTEKSIGEVKERGKRNKAVEEAYYKGGGGKAAEKAGMTRQEVIEKGRQYGNDNRRRKNLEAGGGEGSLAKGKSLREVEEMGKKAISEMKGKNKEEFIAGGGMASGGSLKQTQEKGRKNLENVAYQIGASSGSKTGRKEAIAEGVKILKGLSKEDRVAYTAGGGNKAIMSGIPIDNVLAQGRKNLAKSSVST